MSKGSCLDVFKAAGNPVHLGAMSTAVFSRKKLGTPRGGGSGLVLPFFLGLSQNRPYYLLAEGDRIYGRQAQILPALASVILRQLTLHNDLSYKTFS